MKEEIGVAVLTTFFVDLALGCLFTGGVCELREQAGEGPGLKVPGAV